MTTPPRLLSLEQALARSGRQSRAAWATHVDPERANQHRLLGIERCFLRGEGMELWDESARACLDFTCGAQGLLLGHQPAEVLDALVRVRAEPMCQAAGFPRLAGTLAENLALLLPEGLSRCTLHSSGAEALEQALCTARAARRRERVAFTGPGPRQRAGTTRLDWGDSAALERLLARRETAALVLEPPALAAAGAAEDYPAEARALCRRHGTLLVLDERRSAPARTGLWFTAGALEPDIVVLGESLAAGVFPLGVSITGERLGQPVAGGGPVRAIAPAACAAALKTLEVLQRDGLPERAEALGAHARDALEALARRHALLRGVRGRGLLLGLELAPPELPGSGLEGRLGALLAGRLLNDQALLTEPLPEAPWVLRFEPALTVSEAQIDRAVQALDAVLRGGVAGLMVALGQLWMGQSLFRR